MGEMNAKVAIKDGSKHFGENLVFEKLNMTIEHPGLYVLMGPSGCGKSTLLNIIAGFEKIDEGNVIKKGKTAMIFQNYELINELTIGENIFLHADKRQSDEEIKLLKDLGIDAFKDHQVKELSFGQRQRVGIARALAGKPDIVLCDEPTESLDIINKVVVMDMLKKYSHEHIVIIVSHDLDLIERYYDVIYSYEGKTFIKTKDRLKEKKSAEVAEGKRAGKIAYLTFKMTAFKSFILSLAVILMIGGMWGLYSFKKQIFDIPSSTNTLNADYMYIDVTTPLEVVRKTYSWKADIILKINNIIKDGERKRADVFPYHAKEAIPVEGKEAGSHEIIINQIDNDLSLGDEVILEIVTVSGTFEYPATVVGIVNESDALSSTIYYDLNAVMDDLDEVYEDRVSLKEIVEENPNQFEAEVGYDTIGSFDHDNKVRSPLYDLRNIAVDDSAVYEIIFNGIIIILAILIVVFIALFNRFDAKSFIYQAFILNSLGVSLTKLKALYLTYKYSIICLSVFIGALLAYCGGRMLFTGVYYSTSELLIALFLLIVLYLYYFINLLVSLKDLKRSRMALTLKKQSLS